MKKLLLASAIAAAATSATALEAMSDSAMSETTGQDGLTISLALDVTTDILYIDRDGVGTATEAGALVMEDVTLSGDVDIEVDVASSAGNAESGLVVGLTASNLTVGIAGIKVGGTTAADSFVADSVSAGNIIDGLTATVTGMSVEVILDDGEGLSTGNGSNLGTIALQADQLQISNITINDTDGHAAGAGVAGSLGLGTTTITGLDMTNTLDVDGTEGLVLTITDGIGAGTGMNVEIQDVAINTNSIGDVALQGLDLTGTVIRINGH